ncbi:DUF2793 domain-containing protein [Limoniibacter endophyticus]|uniref:DUF2793 domain-containing protein n=1 Tax=Limoniibacter endophyticus TaxID=1565040 RepID=A0A8J3DH39_9HYPH|nr:DUF2793 domain-containing protein [Limoniibacter endophyticus]GHC69781.1 hypothetical protein GCM10010136_15940 [Limoniibacter endophyticus]
MDRSSILSLPLIMPSQAQKHVTHNEALDMLDALVQLSVLSRTAVAPPAAPALGDRYIIAPDPTGAWEGQAQKLAVWRGNGWDFLILPVGALAYVADEESVFVKHADGWEAVRTKLPGGFIRQDGIGINAEADSYNRFSINAQASLFNHEGGSHRLTMNKNVSSDTATMVFQTNWSGRAEMGLAGNDDFNVKVSADGETWRDAMRIDGASGQAIFPGGVRAPGILTHNLYAALTDAVSTGSTVLTRTGLSCTVTTSSGSARIRLLASLCLGADFALTVPKVGILRNGVRIWPQLADASYYPQTGSAPASTWHIAPALIQCEDQPGEGTFVYEIAIASSDGGPVYLNRRAADTMLVGESSLTLAEIE